MIGYCRNPGVADVGKSLKMAYHAIRDPLMEIVILAGDEKTENGILGSKTADVREKQFH